MARISHNRQYEFFLFNSNEEALNLVDTKLRNTGNEAIDWFYISDPQVLAIRVKPKKNLYYNIRKLQDKESIFQIDI